MKYLILLLIRFYWLLPKRFRSRCLYKETCSHHVYRITKESGFIKGVKSLIIRIETCRPNYSLIDVDNQTFLLCRNGHVINEDEMALWILVNRF